MKNRFKINRNIKYTSDLSGVAVVNLKDKSSLFIEYPEAAIWLVFAEENGKDKSFKMLQAVLGKSEMETRKLINNCIKNWNNSGLID